MRLDAVPFEIARVLVMFFVFVWTIVRKRLVVMRMHVAHANMKADCCGHQHGGDPVGPWWECRPGE